MAAQPGALGEATVLPNPEGEATNATEPRGCGWGWVFNHPTTENTFVVAPPPDFARTLHQPLQIYCLVAQFFP